MARLRHPTKDTLLRDLPTKDKIKLALDFLRENPTEKPSTVARLYHTKEEDSVRKTWLRERNKKKDTVNGSQNKILCPDQHEALIRYAADQAMNGGKTLGKGGSILASDALEKIKIKDRKEERIPCARLRKLLLAQRIRQSVNYIQGALRPRRMRKHA